MNLIPIFNQAHEKARLSSDFMARQAGSTDERRACRLLRSGLYASS